MEQKSVGETDDLNLNNKTSDVPANEKPGSIIEKSSRAKRKGSCDSLLSQKDNDINIVPVKDTISKAKKQLQAILG